MNFGFSREEEAFRAEVVAFLDDWRDLDAFYCQGHAWERVRAFFGSTTVSSSGWQGYQSLVSIGSGGLLGMGGWHACPSQAEQKPRAKVERLGVQPLLAKTSCCR